MSPVWRELMVVPIVLGPSVLFHLWMWRYGPRVFGSADED